MSKLTGSIIGWLVIGLLLPASASAFSMKAQCDDVYAEGTSTPRGISPLRLSRLDRARGSQTPSRYARSNDTKRLATERTYRTRRAHSQRSLIHEYPTRPTSRHHMNTTYQYARPRPNHYRNLSRNAHMAWVEHRLQRHERLREQHKLRRQARMVQHSKPRWPHHPTGRQISHRMRISPAQANWMPVDRGLHSSHRTTAQLAVNTESVETP